MPTKVVYRGDQIDLPHAEMVQLRNRGKLNLGIDELAAAKFTDAGIRPSGTSTAAFKFYRLVALAAFGGGLYMAFTSAWWWGLIGWAALAIIWNANKRGHADNLLDAAMADELFYERIRELGGWIYQIDDDIAHHFLVGNQ